MVKIQLRPIEAALKIQERIEQKISETRVLKELQLKENFLRDQSQIEATIELPLKLKLLKEKVARIRVQKDQRLIEVKVAEAILKDQLLIEEIQLQDHQWIEAVKAVVKDQALIVLREAITVLNQEKDKY